MRSRTRSLGITAMVALALAALALMATRQPAFAADRVEPIPGVPRAELPDVSAAHAERIADGTAAVREQRRRHPGLEAATITFYRGSGDWDISYKAGQKKRAVVTVDGRSGRVIETWQGAQAEWVMARGHDGYFGNTFEAWYVWLPLCLLFVAPFFDPRRPFRLLHLDLLVLLAGFGLSHFLFNRGAIGTSVPLVYPVLAYLLVRMLVAGARRRRTGEPLVPIVPAVALAVGIVLLGGFRIGLSLTEGRVGDVGYASAIGATRIQEDKPLYVDSGAGDLHFDTYGPVNYLAYDPFVRVWQPTRRQIDQPDDFELPAARAAAIAFDLLTLVGLLLLGMQLRPGRAGRLLGLALAYGWVSFPYTLFPLMSSSNDALISALVVFALLGLASPAARGAMIALAGAAKFAPLALAPLFATGRGEARLRSLTWFGLAAGLVAVVTVLPVVPAEGGLRVIYDQTIGFQLGRESPFSIWGQNPGLDPLLGVLKVAAVALVVAVAFVPRRRDATQVAALGAAVLIATQAVAEHWFYLYIAWFTPFVLAALFGEHATGRRAPAPEPEPEAVSLTLAAGERTPAPVGAR